jgi:hypothetical protein
LDLAVGSSGLTITVVFKLSGNPLASERIFDLNNGPDEDNIALSRVSLSSSWQFTVRNGVNLVVAAIPNMRFLQDVVYRIAFTVCPEKHFIYQ